MSVRFGVLVPTRNRADLAERAIRRALACREACYVLVSDNSDPMARDELERRISDINDSRLEVIAPREVLPMTDHWEWAITQMLDRNATHITVLTDRMQPHPGAYDELVSLATREPDAIVTFGNDTVDDFGRRVRVVQEIWSGSVVRVPSRVLLAEAANARVLHAVPRLLNSVVPVQTFERVRNRFGSYVASDAPDLCAAFRLLSQVESVDYYDRSVLVAVATSRSVGWTYQEGGKSDHLNDFADRLQNGWLPNVPVPQVRSIFNALINEYYFVQKEVPELLEPVDLHAYLDRLALDVANKSSAAERDRDATHLAEAGWKGSIDAVPKLASTWRERLRLDPAAFWSDHCSVGRGLARLLFARRATLHAWMLAARVGARLPEGQRFKFRSNEAGLAYALAHPRRRRASSPAAAFYAYQPGAETVTPGNTGA